MHTARHARVTLGALLLVAATGCGAEGPRSTDRPRTTATTHPASPVAAGPATSATGYPGDGCVEWDAHGDVRWPTDTTAAGNRAVRELAALNTNELEPVAASAICSDGRRILLASSTFPARRVRPNGDIEVPLPKPFHVLTAAQPALMKRFGAYSAAYDILRGRYEVGGGWSPLPADTVVDGVPVHFVRRGTATTGVESASAPGTSAAASPSH